MVRGAISRPPGTVTAIVVLWLAAAGIVLYWISFFGAGEVHAASDPCYVVFERNFPLPDGFVAAASVLCAEGLRRRREWALLWGLLAAGGFYFLGLIDTAYNLWNGMYRTRSAAMAAEVAINVFCFANLYLFGIGAGRYVGQMSPNHFADILLTAVMLGSFAVVSLLLAAVGIYGVFAADVAGRRAELGVRRALGAPARDVVLGVVRRALARAALGVALGGAAALVAARAMRSLLFGVGAADPVAFGSVAAILLAVAAAATLVPALHAARVSPLVAMRDE